MKKVLLFVSVLVVILLSTPAHAQYCGGSSGSNICTAITTMTTAGFQPPEDSLPCIVVGQPYSQVIQVHTPATVVQGGSTYPLLSIKIDTISNLPCSMCWAMGSSNFSIGGNATGCLKLTGTTFDAPGQYLLHIIVDATVSVGGIPITVAKQNLSSQGLRYFVRVQLPGDTCIHIDTLAVGNAASHAGALAAPVITGNTTICSNGGSTTLTATGTGYYAYAWSNGTFRASTTVSSTGTYTVTAYGNCTSVTASKIITIANVRDTITAAGPTTFCQGGSVALSVPTGSTYHWSTGATTNSISATTTASYVVTVTNSIGCTAVSSGVGVTVNPLPADTITPGGPLAFCPGGGVTLSGPAGMTYHWSNGTTTQSIAVTQSGSFTLTVTNSNNCSAVSASITTTLNTLPNDTVTASGPTTFCAGGSVTLSGKAGLTYHWSNGATTQSIAVTQAGSYVLTVTNANNCSAALSATTVAVNALPNDTITAGGPLTFCSGGNVVLSAPAGLTYHWSTGATTQNITATQGGNYNLTVTNGNNCSAVSSATTVTVNTNPSNTIINGGPTTFCAGGSVTLTAPAGLNYLWSNSATSQSIAATLSGSYSVTLTNGNNCSATSAPVVVTVNANPNDTVTAGGPTSFCPGENVVLTAATGLTYLWSNNSTTQSVTVTQAGNYTVTVTNTNNCTAVSSGISVTINSLPSNSVTASGPTTFCPGGSVTLTAAQGLTYVWSDNSTGQSITVTQAGSYAVSVTNSNQCSAASSATVVALNNPTIITTQPVSQVTCINGQVTFSVVAGGDNITYQWQKNGVNITGQQSASYNIAAAAFSDTAGYRVIVSGVCGNDTSNAATLSVTGSLTFSQQPASQITCFGNSVSFTVVANGANTTFQWTKNGQNIPNANAATYTVNIAATTDTGSYTCYVTSSCGNATSNAATLVVNLPSFSSLGQSICSNSSYNFNGRLLSSAGTYIDTLNNINGCDSIVTLQLTIKQISSSDTYGAICQGATYTFNGLVFSTSGTYQDTLTGANGCDSIAILHLTVNQPSSGSLSAAICSNSSYNFNGRTLTAAGNYNDTLTNTLGCDSIVTLHLTVNQQVTSSFNAAICAGNNYNFNGRSLTTAGSYNDTLQTLAGCDSIVTLHLTVSQASGSAITTSVCSGTTYTFGGRSLGTSGIYYDTLTNAHGCDSIITLNLTVDQPIRTGIHAAICSGGTYAFNGQQLTTSGTYYAHLTSLAGCDSMITLVLQVNSFVTNNYNASVCAGSPYNFNGRVLTSAGSYSDTLTAHGGCDSIVTVNLSINQPTAGSIHAAICAGGSYSFNGQQLSTAGNYTETLTGANGCDSIVTLTLQVNSFVTTGISGAICPGSSYNFNGHVLTSAGVYHDTLTAQAGCDSIVTLSLTVNQLSSSTINVGVCSGSTYTFNGQQLSTSGTYTETLTGSNGCDSTVTLNLQVNSFVTTTAAANICYGATYNFNGRVLNTTGTYIDTLTAQGGCDSIITLNLIVNPIITHALQVNICAGSSYNFNGQQLSAPGNYRDTLITSGGCDSIVLLRLRVNPILTSNVNAAICTGGSYNFNGHSLTASGTYRDTLVAQGGCDSVVTLNLSIIQGYNIVLHQAICAGSSYNFNGQYLALSGTYSDTLSSQGGCDSITTLFLTVEPSPVVTWNQADTICDNNGATQITITAPSPAGGILNGNGLNGLVLTINGTGVYPVTYTYVAGDGCSNSVTKDLVVESCLDIEQINPEAAISIYPNPANDVVTAQADILANIRNTPLVYDITGKLIEVPFTQQADKVTFSTGNLASGMYLIRFNINGTLISKRFVKAD